MSVCPEVSAFSTWDKELHKMVFDPRYLLLALDQRKQVPWHNKQQQNVYRTADWQVWWCWHHCDVCVCRCLISLWRAGWRMSTKRRKVNCRRPEKSSNSCWRRQRSPAGMTCSSLCCKSDLSVAPGGAYLAVSYTDSRHPLLVPSLNFQQNT